MYIIAFVVTIIIDNSSSLSTSCHHMIFYDNDDPQRPDGPWFSWFHRLGHRPSWSLPWVGGEILDDYIMMMIRIVVSGVSDHPLIIIIIGPCHGSAVGNHDFGWWLEQDPVNFASPIIPHSWPGLVWKRVSPLDVITRGSQQPFSCVLDHFRHGDNQTTNWVILMQACSCPVRRQSFAIVVSGVSDYHLSITKMIIIMITWWSRKIMSKIVILMGVICKSGAFMVFF